MKIEDRELFKDHKVAVLSFEDRHDRESSGSPQCI